MLIMTNKFVGNNTLVCIQLTSVLNFKVNFRIPIGAGITLFLHRPRMVSLL
uniref:Uncharacterized protein n=1 Tax=Anguilla anguilla TaxID=7936 RepID=A0A0E9P9R6_ANGAN